MLMWIEGHLILLGVIAVVAGLGLGVLWNWARSRTGTIESPRRLAVRSAVARSDGRTTGARTGARG